MNLNEFFDHLDEVKKFAPGVYTHQVKALTVMPTQDKTLWADAGELPKKFNVTQMNIGIYDEEDDNDPYSYGNTGLEVFHDAGTWQMYTDDQTEQQISDYLGVKVSFSEQGMQNEKFMHFDISDEAVAQLIDKGAFKMTKAESVDEASDDDYGYTWNCKKCGAENEFTMTPQEKQEYIDDWEADNQDLVADGESGQGALDNLLLDQGEDSGMHYGNKCVKCGTEAKDPYSETIDDIIRLSGSK